MSALLRIADGIAVTGVAVLLAVVAGAILARIGQDLAGGALALSLPGHVELARHALMVAMLSALPGAAARGLVRVELLADRLPRGIAAGLDRLWMLALAGFAGLAAWRFAVSAAGQARAGEVSQVLAYPLWPVTAHAGAALALLAGVALARALGRAA